MDSSRITLRPYRSTDVDDLISWASDDRVTRSIHFSTLISKDEALTFIDKSSIPWRRSICIDDRSVGIVVARPGSGDDRCRAEVGYALAVEYWGQGITPKAVKMAIPLILEEFPEIVRLQALTDAMNKASHRVLEKAGFIKEEKVAPAPSASQLCKTKVQFLSDPQRLRRVAGGFIRVVKIGLLRLSPEKIGEDIAKKTVKNGKVF